MADAITINKDTYSEYAAKALKYDTLAEAILREKYEYYGDIIDYPDNFVVYYNRGVVHLEEEKAKRGRVL